MAATYIERLIDVTPYTRTKYKTHLEMHLDVLEMPVDVITADDIARWVAWMQIEAPVRGAKKAGYSPKTIKNAHGFLSSVLSYAVKRGLRADNGADAITGDRLICPTVGLPPAAVIADTVRSFSHLCSSDSRITMVLTADRSATVVAWFVNPERMIT